MGADNLPGPIIVDDGTSDPLADLWDFLPPITASLARRYARFVEAEDVTQELWVYALRNRDTVCGLLDPVPPDGMDTVPREVIRASHQRLVKRLTRAGERYCRREKARLSGYQPEDEYFYDTGVIEAVLPVALDPARDPAHMEVSHDQSWSRVKRDPAEGANLPALVSDVRRAVENLPGDQLSLLVTMYAPGRLLSRGEHDRERDAVPRRQHLVAELLGITQQAVSERHRRAIRSVQRALGGDYPGRE